MSDINQIRNYWDRRPCNIRHSAAEVGSREYFDEVESRKYKVEPHIPQFAQFERWRGKRVLEVGCGIGTDAVNFARAGADYTGLELSGVSLELARRRFDVYGLNGRFILGDAEKISEYLDDNKFDLIYSFGVIHHTPNPSNVIAEARKVIKDDGELRIMLYSRNSWKAIMIEAGFDQPEAQSECPVAFTSDEYDIHNLLAGFKVISIQPEHIFPYIVEEYVKYRYELQPWFKAMPPAMFTALEKRLGWHLCIVARPR
jgi:SAM-dependent methyltransferase